MICLSASPSQPLAPIRLSVNPLGCVPRSQALEYAQAQPYHAVLSNCIQSSDFLVRVLTGGRVRGAPIIYDKLCGHVPPLDSPLLLMLQLTMQTTWCAAPRHK
jgi:hypothetical protein